MKTETWKDVVGFYGTYQISDLGNVKSIDRYVKQRKLKSKKKQFKKGRILKQQISNNGYKRVQLNDEFKIKKYSVHRLVAKAFIPNLENKEQVNHKNGIKTDNRVENLEWVTKSENQFHAIATGLQPHCVGTKRGRVCKITERIAKEIKRKLKEGITQNALAKEYNLHQSNISYIKNKTWQHV